MTETIEFAQKLEKDGVWDIAIIGSGPAALTAAIYTTRGAASTIILGGDSWGGQLMLTTIVDNYPGFPEGIQGPELMQKMRDQAERFGAEFVAKNVESVDFAKDLHELVVDDTTYKAKAVIIATGADTKWLGVPGEDKLRGRGVSSCAPCDAPFFKDKNVAVVGGGDSAMEEALTLTKYSSQVTIIHRRDALKASAAMQKKVMDNKKIRVMWDSDVVEMVGENKLESLKIKTKLDSKQGKDLQSGKLDDFKITIVEEKEGFIFWEMPVDGVFVAIGHTPATKIFRERVETDEKGYVVVHNHAKTNIEKGVFVAGDVHDYTYRQAITAAGFGCMAGMEALKYLDKSGPSW